MSGQAIGRITPQRGKGVVPADADPAAPIILEFESPTAALLARPVPFRSRFVTWVICSMVVALVIISVTAPIDRVVSTSGKVVATSSNIVVQPLETSIVRSINVKEGQVVHKGDVLAQLDPTFATADAGSLQSQVTSLQAEVTRLQDEQDGKPYETDGSQASQLQAVIFAQRHAEITYKMDNYQQKIDGLTAKVAAAKQDITSFTARLDVAKTLEDKRRELERLQVGSQLNTLSATDNRVEIARNLDTARSTLSGAQRDLDAMKSERDGFLKQFEADTSQSLTDQGRKLSQAKEDFNKAKLRRNLVQLTADRDAIVLTVAPVSVGSVMQSGDQFITLVPTDSPLEIETIIDGRDAGFVAVGDTVTVKFETFPYTIYGTAVGTVQTVSADSFAHPMQDAEKVGRPRAEAELGQMYYRAHISLDEMKLHNLPPGFRVEPGMPVSGDIKVGKRTVMQYIMSRVIPATTEGMREP
jgi:hemolysin D